MTKRIGIFSHASALEGAERSAITVIEALRRTEWEILAFVRELGDFTNELQDRGISFERLRYNWWETDNETIDAGWSRHNYLSAHEAAEKIREFGAQLIYTNTSVISVGALAAALSGVPHIWHIRELADGLIFEKHKKALPAIGNFMGTASNMLVFNSRYTLKSWEPFLPKGTPTEVIYNAVPTPKIETPDAHKSGLNIAVIGSILPLKAQKDALEAVKILIGKGLETQIYFIGPVRGKSYKGGLDAIVAQNQLEKNVHFVGFQENPFDTAATCDVVVVPGNAEGFGRVTAEAMLAEIPVIAASGGATNELIQDGETGLLFEKANPLELAQKIELLISNTALRDKLVKNAKLFIENLTSANKTTAALLAILAETVNEKNKLQQWLPLVNPFEKSDEILPLVKGKKLVSVLKERVMKKKK